MGVRLIDRSDDHEKIARLIQKVGQARAGDNLTDEEWIIIEARASRRDLATEEKVERLFSRYRSA